MVIPNYITKFGIAQENSKPILQLGELITEVLG